VLPAPTGSARCWGPGTKAGLRTSEVEHVQDEAGNDVADGAAVRLRLRTLTGAALRTTMATHCIAAAPFPPRGSGGAARGTGWVMRQAPQFRGVRWLRTRRCFAKSAETFARPVQQCAGCCMENLPERLILVA
jgi:hypothetical protein